MATESTYKPDEDEVSVKEVLLSIQVWVNYLLSKWRLLLIVVAVGSILGLIYSLIEVPKYTATTTFVLEGEESGSGLRRLSGMAALAGIDLGGGAGGLFQSNNIVELYKSRRMLEQTLLSPISPDSKELLIDRYITYNSIKEDEWDDQPELLALDFKHDPESLDSLSRRLRDGVITSFANAIRSDVLVIEAVQKNLSILRVDVTSPDEEFSKVFNETLVRKVNEFYTQTKTKKSSATIEILQHKVDSVRAVMSGAIYSAAAATDATPNLNPTRQVQRTVPAQEAQFSAEANRNMLSQLLQNLELTKLTLMQEQPLFQLVDQPVFPLKIDRVGRAKAIIIGGFCFGLLAIIFLIIRRYFRNIMAE